VDQARPGRQPRGQGGRLEEAGGTGAEIRQLRIGREFPEAARHRRGKHARRPPFRREAARDPSRIAVSDPGKRRSPGIHLERDRFDNRAEAQDLRRPRYPLAARHQRRACGPVPRRRRAPRAGNGVLLDSRDDRSPQIPPTEDAGRVLRDHARGGRAGAREFDQGNRALLDSERIGVPHRPREHLLQSPAPRRRHLANGHRARDRSGQSRPARHSRAIVRRDGQV